MLVAQNTLIEILCRGSNAFSIEILCAGLYVKFGNLVTKLGGGGVLKILFV